MRNRFIPMLEVLEDKLPPGNISALAELAGPNQMTSAIGINPKPTNCTNQKSDKLLVTETSELLIAPQASLANPSTVSSNSASATRDSESPSLTSLGDEKNSLAQMTSSIKAMSDVSFLTAPTQTDTYSRQPTIAVPAFVDHVQGSIDFELDYLTFFAGQNSPPPTGGGGTGGGGTGGNGFDDGSGDWGYHLDNNDGYVLHLQSVTFDGNKFNPVYHDLGTQGVFAAPHWLDTNYNNKDDRTEGTQPVEQLPGRDMGEPISFGSSIGTASMMTADATLILDYIPPGEEHPSDNDPIDKTLFVHGIAYPGPGLPAMYTNIIDIGDPKADIGVVQLFTFQQPLMSSVFHWADMQIDWQFVYNDHPPEDVSLLWTTFNSSHNPNFITLKTSQATKLYLTLADYTTLAADGEITEAGVVSKMWTRVSSLNVYRSEDGQPLCYYNNWGTIYIDVSKLLSEGDGQCGAWELFWIESLLTNGLSGASIVKVEPVDAFEGLLVKNWDFATATPLPTPRTHLLTIYPYENEWSGSTYVNNNKYDFDVTYSVKDQTGLPGQTNSNPISNFNLHYIVNYGNLYYDPSYGNTYTSAFDMQTKAISGFYFEAGKVWIMRPVVPTKLEIKFT